MGQAHQVIIVLKLKRKKDKTIMRERVILIRLIKWIVTPQREENDTNPEGRKRGDGRILQIHQVQWRL